MQEVEKEKERAEMRNLASNTNKIQNKEKNRKMRQ